MKPAAVVSGDGVQVRVIRNSQQRFRGRLQSRLVNGFFLNSLLNFQSLNSLLNLQSLNSLLNFQPLNSLLNFQSLNSLLNFQSLNSLLKVQLLNRYQPQAVLSQLRKKDGSVALVDTNTWRKQMKKRHG